ncbi:MAG: hypothetical protein IPP40_07315 [bacterium]|nr:hypothetical protein [bacterium]
MAWGRYSGGLGGSAEGDYSAVSGGNGNNALGNKSVVAGGDANSANSLSSTVGGGSNNVAAGLFSAIPGGALNSAGDYSLAAGQQAHADHRGSFVWGDSRDTTVSTTSNDQFIARASGGVKFFTDSAMTRGARLDRNQTAGFQLKPVNLAAAEGISRFISWMPTQTPLMPRKHGYNLTVICKGIIMSPVLHLWAAGQIILPPTLQLSPAGATVPL